MEYQPFHKNLRKKKRRKKRGSLFLGGFGMPFMAGMPLFAHVGRELYSAAPFGSIEANKVFSALTKTPKSLFKIPRRRTGLVFASFAPQNRQKREESRGFVRILRFCLCDLGFREKITLTAPRN